MVREWFANCGWPATTTLAHPVLGSVPTRTECAEKAARLSSR